MKMNPNPVKLNQANLPAKTSTLHKYIKPKDPILRFSPTAWAKLLYFRDHNETEIGGFGISDPGDLLYVQDFQTVKQQVTSVSVSFYDEAVADFFEDQTALVASHSNLPACGYIRILVVLLLQAVQTRTPFNVSLAKCDWGVLFIVAQDGKTYAIAIQYRPGWAIAYSGTGRLYQALMPRTCLLGKLSTKLIS